MFFNSVKEINTIINETLGYQVKEFGCSLIQLKK